MKEYDVIVIGAGASGLMCAIEAAKRGRRVLVLDSANKAGKKILMSGGGRCNFTNYSVEPENYLSNNEHFCKSALSRFTQWDFLALVDKYHIAFHERSHGQLFCNESSKEILAMLLNECKDHHVKIKLKTSVSKISQNENANFILKTDQGDYCCESLVVATGGLSIPKMGATPFGYKIAEQFNLLVKPTRAGLVPFTLDVADKERFSPLSGIAVDAVVTLPDISFRENVLFTHRGLSGPAILQISSYWQPGQGVVIDLLPDVNLGEKIQAAQAERSNQSLRNYLAQYLPKRLLETMIEAVVLDKSIKAVSSSDIALVEQALQAWQIFPNGTEGYRTAEVTVGGVDCNELSSKTFETKKVAGLYFVGEVIDVTGWLGGYNFQWAWASGWCAGQYV